MQFNKIILKHYCRLLYASIRSYVYIKIVNIFPKLFNVFFKQGVDIPHMNLTRIPIHFKEINGYFNCSSNKLTNLIGAPKLCTLDFFCHSNKLTSLEGSPLVIKGHLHCHNNPDLKYLWGIGRVYGDVRYTNRNDEINVWIIACMRKDIIFPHSGIYALEENINWIMREHHYSSLLGAPQKIRKYFSPSILSLVDLKIL